MNRALALLTLLALAACDPPPVYGTADRRQNTSLSRIEGSVVVNSKVRGNVIVLLFDILRPPPPTGSGRPVTFAVVSREAVFGTAGENDTGPFVAPFAFSLVPAGHYTIRGFVDGNSDFVPWYDVTSQVNTGDVGGGAVEPSTKAFRDVRVEVNLPALDVPVSFSDTAQVTLDRPSFSVFGTTGLTLVPAEGPKVIELDLLPLNDGLIHQSRAAFLAKFIDDNMDGVPDDANGDGVPDLWPKVLVRKLSAVEGATLLDENDLDHNGVLDTGGADYDHVNPTTGAVIPKDGKSDAVILAAGFDPTNLAPALVDSMTGMIKTVPTAVPKLNLVIKPLAVDISDPTAPQILKTVPPGRYAITVVNLTGQTWRLPNELSPGIAENFSLPSVMSQNFVITVPAP
jgi:hypothetical protein